MIIHSARVGLVMHGGGMRGAYGAGLIEALFSLRGSSSITIVAGTSAGAANIVLAALGAISILHEVWTHELHQKSFFDLLRAPYITNIDYMINLCEKYGVSNKRLHAAAVTIFIACTHYLDGTTKFFSNQHDLLAALRATLSMPLLSRTPVMVEREPYLDGGISTCTNDLIRESFKAGADKVIAVDLSSPLTWYQRWALRGYARTKSVGLKKAMIRMIHSPHPELVAPDPRVYLIRPLETMVTRLSAIPEKLKAAYERGRQETLEDGKLKDFLNS